MKQPLSVLGLAAGVVIALASGAAAQSPAPATDKFYLNVNIGGQFANRTLDTNVTKTVYDEPATLVGEQKIGDGALFDIGGGYRVYNDVHVGLTITRFSNTQEATYTASIPDPFVFNNHKTTSGIADNLHRTEIGWDPYALWVTALRDKIDLSVALGLSIIHVNQETLSDFNVPAPTQNVDVQIVEEHKTGVGFFTQADFLYALTPRYGAGVYLRYAGASVDFDSGASSDAGGFQFGAGVRVHF